MLHLLNTLTNICIPYSCNNNFSISPAAQYICAVRLSLWGTFLFLLDLMVYISWNCMIYRSASQPVQWIMLCKFCLAGSIKETLFWQSRNCNDNTEEIGGGDADSEEKCAGWDLKQRIQMSNVRDNHNYVKYCCAGQNWKLQLHKITMDPGGYRRNNFIRMNYTS